MQKLAHPQGTVTVLHPQLVAYDQRSSTEEEVAEPKVDRGDGHESREGGSNSRRFGVMSGRCAARLGNADHERKSSRFLCESCAAYNCGSNLEERVLNCTCHVHKHMTFPPWHIGTSIHR